MDNQVRQIMWGIARKMLGEDQMHGIPHIKRVYANFKIWKDGLSLRISPLLESVIDATESAVLSHDLGRSSGGDAGHAAESAKILENLFQAELNGVENKDWIRYAVANHSTGLRHEPQEDKDTVLGLLCLFDHMDSLGPIGIQRLTICWCGGEPFKIPWVPHTSERPEKNESVKRLLWYHMWHPGTVGPEHAGMRASSFLECLVYHYCITSRIVSPIRYLMGEKIQANLDSRLEIMKNHIMGLIDSLL